MVGSRKKPGEPRPGVPHPAVQGTLLASQTLPQTFFVKLTTSFQLFEETAHPRRAVCFS